MNISTNSKILQKWLSNFDNSITDFLELLVKKWANPNPITLSLCGIDTEKSWILRRKLSQKNVDSGLLLLSLSWLDSEEAWRWRLWFLNANTNHARNFLLSLRGVDSEKSWEWREKLKENVRGATILKSLAGLDSEKSWKYRDKYFTDYENYIEPKRNNSDKPLSFNEYWIKNFNVIWLGDCVESLYALDSDISWEWRQKFVDWVIQKELKKRVNNEDQINPFLSDDMTDFLDHQYCDLSTFLISTIGIDSDRAWRFREKCKISNDQENSLLISLVWINTEKAWNIRNEKVFSSSFWYSLAGINSKKSWEIRNELLEEYCKHNEYKTNQNNITPEWEIITDLDRNKWNLAFSLSWNYETFLWRLNKKLIEEEIIYSLEE